MKTTFVDKTASQSIIMSQPDASTGQNVISLAPPDYGIDFVDSGLESRPKETLQSKSVNAVQRKGHGEGFRLDNETASRINRARRGGQPLDYDIQEKMSETMGYDFGDVRVHTDSEADALNQQLSANAFTTGHDIFFERGEYNPGSGSGRELISHELCHVIQQSSGRINGESSGIRVYPAGAYSEQKADKVAETVTRSISTSVQGQRPTTQYDVSDRLALQGAAAGPSKLRHAVKPLREHRRSFGRKIQRKIAYEDEGVMIIQNLDHLKDVYKDEDDKLKYFPIMALWHMDKGKVHAFKPKNGNTPEDRLREALKKAVESGPVKPLLFTHDNLKFITKAQGRDPTLYFRTNGQDGRLRQQHGGGPLSHVSKCMHEDYFSKDEKGRFKANIENLLKMMRQGKATKETLDSTFRTVKEEGASHFEVWFQDNKTWLTKHPSEGKVLVNTAGYTDEVIEGIYRGLFDPTTADPETYIDVLSQLGCTKKT